MKTVHSRQTERRPAYTLTELLISIAASSLLLMGLASSIYLASQAANPNSTTANTIQGGMTAAEIAAELRSAILFDRRSATSVRLVVADRDNNGLPELIEYTWSGTLGDPLRRQFNQGTVVDVLEDVHAFELSYFVRPAVSPPRVLFVVPSPASLSSGDDLRELAMRSWGSPVSLIASTAPSADFAAAVIQADVAYVTENVFSNNLGTKLTDAPIGVVTEEPALYDELGISSSSSRYTNDEVDIVDNTHPITSEFSTGRLTICTSNQGLVAASGTLAPDADVLAERVSSSRKVLVAVDYGGQLYNGQSAAGRRVMLPWGGGEFDFSSLTMDGLMLMRRAIQWAAGTDRLTRIQVVLQVGPSPYSRLETEIDILNQPRVPGR